MRELGIGDGDTVVAYDDQGGVIAARLVWMLRATGREAALLDGGSPPGRGRSRPSRPGARRRRSRARPWPAEALASADDAADPRNAVIDARQRERYLGEGPDPVDPRPGHIPGARSLPTREHLGEDGRLLPREELRRRFEAAGVDGAKPVVSYCGSGVTACHNLVVLEHAGLGAGRLYPGSWSQWSGDPSRPAETGEERMTVPLLTATELVAAYRDARALARSRSPTPRSSGSRRSTATSTRSASSTPTRALADARASEARWRRGDARRPARRRAGRVKDLLVTRGWPTLRGSRAIDPAGPWEDDAPVVAALRRSRRRAARQDDDARARLEGRHRQRADRRDPQPVGPGDDGRRIERRQLRGARGGDGAARARHRRRRLDPDPVRVLRAARPEADVRARAGLAGEPVRPGLARRPDGAHGRRPRAAARRDRAARRPRLAAAAAARPARSAPGSTTASPGLRIAFSPELGHAAVDPEIAGAGRAGGRSRSRRSAPHVELADPGFADPRDDLRRPVVDRRRRARSPASATRDGIDPGLAEIAAQGRASQRRRLPRRVRRARRSWRS